jgi:hypothetical protein
VRRRLLHLFLALLPRDCLKASGLILKWSGLFQAVLKKQSPAAGYEPDVCHPNIAGSFSIYWEKEQNTAPGSAISGSERKTLPELAL